MLLEQLKQMQEANQIYGNVNMQFAQHPQLQLQQQAQSQDEEAKGPPNQIQNNNVNEMGGQSNVMDPNKIA